MVYVCAVCHAEQSKANPHLVFHRLPNNPVTKQKWLEILNKEGVKNLVVCNQHFTPEDYRPFCDKLLKQDAIPRINVPKIDPPSQLVENIQLSPQKVEEDVSEDVMENAILESASRSSKIDAIDRAPKTVHCLKRTNNQQCDDSGLSKKQRCVLKSLGCFRREDFANEDAWLRFLKVMDNMRKNNRKLQYKNKLLLRKLKFLQKL